MKNYTRVIKKKNSTYLKLNNYAIIKVTMTLLFLIQFYFSECVDLTLRQLPYNACNKSLLFLFSLFSKPNSYLFVR